MRTARTPIVVAVAALWCAAPVPSAIAAPVVGEVAYVQATQVYLSLGTADGAQVGARAEARPATGAPVALELLYVAERSSVAAAGAGGARLRPGDRVVLLGDARAPTSPPVALLRAPTSVASTPRVGVPATFEKVNYHSTRGARPYLRGTLARTDMRSQGWAYVDAGRDSLYLRERLDVFVHGAVDEAGRVLVDADLSAYGEPERPADVRDRVGERAWLELHRGTLGYRDDSGLGVDVGRMALGRLRYGVVDGLGVNWRGEGGSDLRLLVGARPTTRRLAPTRAPANRLFAGFDFAGAVTPTWGRLHYGANGAWLGDDGVEAAVQVGGSMSDALSVDAEVGAIAWRAVPTGPLRETVDRAVVSVMWRPERATLVRVHMRRLENAPVPSELVALPEGYLPGGASYQGGGAIDRGFVLPWSWPLRAGVEGGAAWDADRAASRYWASPSLHLGLSATGRVSLRLAYLAELGWMGGHRGEVGIDARIGDHWRLGASQQGGVLRLDASRQQLGIATSALRVGYELRSGITIGLRARCSYGEVGTGTEGYVWVGGAR